MSDKPVRFVSSARGQKVMTIELAEGRSAEEVLALLNEGKAILGGEPMHPGLSIKSRIILPGDTGVAMLADCEVSNDSSFEAWEIERDEPCHCCNVTPEERDRNQADSLALRAHRLADAGGDKLPMARSLLQAARALIRNAGTSKCKAMVTVLTAQANIETRYGMHAAAVKTAMRARRLAETVLPENDPSRMLCVGNIGEALNEGGWHHEARPYLERALDYFRAIQPLGNWSREWIDANLIPHYEKLLAPSSTASE